MASSAPKVSPKVAASKDRGHTPDLLARSAKLLGGKSIFKRELRSRLEVHEAIVGGLPGRVLVNVMASLQALRQEDVAKALGVSVRTYQRVLNEPSALLSIDQSGRAWKFAEVVARAIEVFGGAAEAVAWLQGEALALDGRRPIELLRSPAGTEMVEQLLGRLEYGVFT
jgi:putative toxin-antitoxin system antitoxin component (TIGR02293 family)